ncbi:MAG: 30S ribosomal protein S6 [Bacteroidota bacterium]
MNTHNYETVFIITPVLPEQQVKDTVEKFRKFLLDNSAEIINEEQWGLRKLAYPIGNKTTGHYVLVEYKAPTSLITPFEVEFRRDERIIRFLTTALDKHALAYNDKRRSGKFRKNTETTETVQA